MKLYNIRIPAELAQVLKEQGPDKVRHVLAQAFAVECRTQRKTPKPPERKTKAERKTLQERKTSGDERLTPVERKTNEQAPSIPDMPLDLKTDSIPAWAANLEQARQNAAAKLEQRRKPSILSKPADRA